MTVHVSQDIYTTANQRVCFKLHHHKEKIRKPLHIIKIDPFSLTTSFIFNSSQEATILSSQWFFTKTVLVIHMSSFSTIYINMLQDFLLTSYTYVFYISVTLTLHLYYIRSGC